MGGEGGGTTAWPNASCRAGVRRQAHNYSKQISIKSSCNAYKLLQTLTTSLYVRRREAPYPGELELELILFRFLWERGGILKDASMMWRLIDTECRRV